MSISELAALARRHVVAVTIVLLAAAGIAYTFKRTPAVYQESATVVLTAPGSEQRYTAYGRSMITAGEVVVDWITGPKGQQVLRHAGVPDAFNVALVNYSNMEYPYYAVPYLTVVATAPYPAVAHQEYVTVLRVLNDYLAALQVQHAVAPRDRVTTTVIGDTGPLIQRGSRIRTFAGLAVLTLMAAYLVSRFLDRHRFRLSGLLRADWRGTRPTSSHSASVSAQPGGA